MKNLIQRRSFGRRLKNLFCSALLSGLMSAAIADVPTRVGVTGAVPNPGTQQQELSNITFPAPYNVFEFLVTCGACHGGQVDQQVAHFGNWAGTNKASASRDPVFRAKANIVNEQIRQLTGKDGGGAMCYRCHSPNGWYSGRFDPALNGAPDGSSMLHSILLSTDDEGVPCEACHRALGAVTYQRPDLDLFDPVWNMLADIDDWPHSGGPFVDQDGDPTLVQGNPYGNGALQFDEGMTYIGRYPGTVDIYWDDLPILDALGTPGGNYTGQTYGIFPPGWLDNWGNDVGGQPATAADGSLLVQLDIPIGPPLNPDGSPNYNAQSVSPEHATVKYPNAPPAKGFIQTSEFCGACHEETIPVLNHGMPVQRTYSEWKYSAFGREGPDQKSCQECHMPRLSHEYADDIPGSFNADPFGEPGGWPYSKARTNTAVHKLAGANRDLPMMMQQLYPEADFEVVGGGEGAGGVWVGTGNDTRIFPGMLSNRDSMWERTRRNTEISLRDAVDLAITQPPTLVDTVSGTWEVKVRVTNNSGHRIPSGYPDGRRLWIGLKVTDAAGNSVYQSGHYDGATARLTTDPGTSQLTRARTALIDARVQNAVMVYERVTGSCTVNDLTGDLTACTEALGPLNDYVLFDNRIPPFGFNYNDYRQSGVKFWNYDPATRVPFEERTRYPSGSNRDEVTYRFTAPVGAILNARAEANWQTHSRDFMEYLRANDTSTVRPEGPPRVWEANYPLTPNYLSDEFGLDEVSTEIQAAGLISEPLRDNWGGIAYAAWYVTGKGAPYSVALADTAATLPAAPGNLQVSPQCDPVTGACTGGVPHPDTGLTEPYTQRITWDAVPGAEGYRVWIKYGIGATSASWDKLAMVEAPATELINTALNVNKSYVYKVEAFNGAGYGPASAAVAARTPWDLPLPADNLQFVSSTTTSITMSWYDAADNEEGWLVLRQTAPADPQAGFTEVGRFLSTTGFGGVLFSDDTVQPGSCYNYVVEAYNSAGNSGWNTNGPVQMCTQGVPAAPSGLSAVAVNAYQVDLTWTAPTGSISGYRIERSGDNGVTWPVSFDVADPAASGFSDTTVQPATSYLYRVFAYNGAGDSLASAPASVTTPAVPPAAPSGLSATPSDPGSVPPVVDLAWTDNATSEQGFIIERAPDSNGAPGTYAEIGRTMVPAADSGSRVRWSDTAVEPKMTYWYRVAAYNASGNSPYSNAVSVVTPGEIPEAPANLQVTRTTRTSIRLSWDDNSTNELGFYLERSSDGGANWTRIARKRANRTRHTDRGLASGTTYWYRVQAYNADGVTQYSNVAVGTTRNRRR